ncbi:hypothetical protein ANO14919_032430 [Xylariales sp. No.14919]|nr:hypothetical protein ANO14919_032430 [Xylariales sp. No.14919]
MHTSKIFFMLGLASYALAGYCTVRGEGDDWGTCHYSDPNDEGVELDWDCCAFDDCTNDNNFCEDPEEGQTSCTTCS